MPHQLDCCRVKMHCLEMICFVHSDVLQCRGGLSCCSFGCAFADLTAQLQYPAAGGSASQRPGSGSPFPWPAGRGNLRIPDYANRENVCGSNPASPLHGSGWPWLSCFSDCVDGLAVQTVPNQPVNRASETPDHSGVPWTVFHIRVAVPESSSQNLDLLQP